MKKESLKAAKVPENPSRRDKYNFIADVVQETGSSLVFIEVNNVKVREFLNGDSPRASKGSGFLVDSEGLILTNAHVISDVPGSNTIQVKLQDGRHFAGQIEALDKKSDLATIRIPCKNLPVMKLGQSSKIRPGEFVIAMGSPLALRDYS